MLESEVSKKVQAYIRYMYMYMYVREGGNSISTRLVIAGAKSILLSSNHSLLAEYGGPVTLTLAWVHSLLKRMKFTKRKSTTAKNKLSPDTCNFKQLKHNFLEEVMTNVQVEKIPAELVLN